MSQHSRNRQSRLFARVLRGSLSGALRRRGELRYRLVREVWATTKRFGADTIEDVEIRQLPGVRDAVVEGYVDDRNRAVVAALCDALGARTFFEIGTNRGRTAWTVARHNPRIEVYTLDLPGRDAIADVRLAVNEADHDFFTEAWDRGEAYRGSPEEDRIHTLLGDSATFDFSPYAGAMDVVFVDGAHSYEYVRSDTRQALRMLSPGGTIVWDDYPAHPGVYEHLTNLAGDLDRPLFHVLETRLVVYSRRRDLVERLPPDDRRRVHAA